MKKKFTIRIKNKKEGAFKKILAWFSENSNGEFESIWEQFGADELVNFHVEIKPSIPEFDKRKVIKKTIKRLGKYKKYQREKDQVKAFKNALAVELRQMEKQKKKFKILFFFNINKDDFGSYTKITFNNQNIEILSWNQLGSLEMQELYKYVDRYKKKLPCSKNHICFKHGDQYYAQEATFAPCLIELEGYSYRGVANEAVFIFDLFRSLLNLIKNSRQIRLFGQGHFSTYLPSPIYGIFDDDGNYKNFLYAGDFYNYTRIPLSLKNLEKAQKYVVDLGTDDNGFVKHIQEVLVLFQKAIDKTSDDSIYLGLWQVLENALCKEDSQSHKDVEKRVRSILNFDANSREAQNIDMLAQYRHQLVHKDKFPDMNGNIINMLHYYTATTIQILLNSLSLITNIDELRELLNLKNMSQNTLKRKVKIINLLLPEDT